MENFLDFTIRFDDEIVDDKEVLNILLRFIISSEDSSDVIAHFYEYSQGNLKDYEVTYTLKDSIKKIYPSLNFKNDALEFSHALDEFVFSFFNSEFEFTVIEINE